MPAASTASRRPSIKRFPFTEIKGLGISRVTGASREPKRGAAYKMFYYENVGNMTLIAQRLHVAERTARRYLLPVRLGRHFRRRRTATKPLRRLSRQSRGGDFGLNML